MLTKASLITKLQAELGDGQNQSADDTIYGQWVDEAVQVIWNLWKWKWKYTTSTVTVLSGVTTFPVPNTFSQVDNVALTDTGRQVINRRRNDMIDNDVDFTLSAAEPDVWYWADYDTTLGQKQIGLWRVPSADVSITFRGLLRPDAEITSSDTLPLPEEFLPALNEYIRFRSQEAEELTSLSDRSFKRFGARVSEAASLLAAHDPEVRSHRILDADLKQIGPYGAWRPPTVPNTIPWE
jgi:hypothetical protein